MPSWLKLDQSFWRTRLINVVHVLLLLPTLVKIHVFLLLRYHLPLEKGMALNLIHLKKLESPLPKDGLNRTSGQRETDRQTDRQTERSMDRG